MATAAVNPVQSAQKDATGVTIKLQSGVLRLTVCDDRTIHVTASATNTLPEKKEFVVNRTWTPVPFDFREEPAKLSLHTPRMGVEVNRTSGVLTFTDSAGKLLLQEPADGGRTLTDPKPSTPADQPDTYHIQQTFLSPTDERLYGMAEGQDGTWNWSAGMPIELRQPPQHADRIPSTGFQPRLRAALGQCVAGRISTRGRRNSALLHQRGSRRLPVPMRPPSNCPRCNHHRRGRGPRGARSPWRCRRSTHGYIHHRRGRRLCPLRQEW